MKVRVQLFAGVKQRLGQDHVDLDLPDSPRVADLRRALAEGCPELADLLPHLAFAVNAEYAPDAATIPANADVACIPPVSGG